MGGPVTTQDEDEKFFLSWKVQFRGHSGSGVDQMILNRHSVKKGGSTVQHCVPLGLISEKKKSMAAQLEKKKKKNECELGRSGWRCPPTIIVCNV